MILLIDNYDSFTYNIYQYLREITDEEVRVLRNDAATVADIRTMAPRCIIISPGPGRPEDAGVSVDCIREFGPTIPILGVCLGHQAIGYAFGAKIVGAKRIVHGKVEAIAHDGRGIFRSVETPARFTRYHSLVVAPDTLPEELEATAWSADGELMGIRHKRYTIEGVQFHPESIASDHGRKILSNFLKYKREPFVAKTVLSRLIDREDLSMEEAENFMEELTEGNVTPIQIGAFLVALNAKGITPPEIAGCSRVLQRKRVPITSSIPALDTCGTGGDGIGSFNISSMAALVAAACGARVAKHGNRAVSSRSGSADFYRALGINLELTPPQSQELLERSNFAFLFAPLYHGAMRYAGVPRRELAIKTIMNLLGPLSNPAAARYQLIGVYAESLCEPVARAANLLGIERAMVVHGLDGIDEVSISAPTRIVKFGADGKIESSILDPADFGITGYTLADLEGGDPPDNADMAWQIARGGGKPAIRDSVYLNAAAALTVYGLADGIASGLEQVRRAFEDGRVLAKMQEAVTLSNELAYREAV